MIKTEFQSQFRQTWVILGEIIQGFDDHSWTQCGCGYMTPAALALHVLRAVLYYIGDDDGSALDLSDGLNRRDILRAKNELARRVERWVEQLVPDDENTRFPWAGETAAGVLVFLLRHTMYHVGELNALAYLSKNGDIQDHWMKGFGSDESR